MKYVNVCVVYKVTYNLAPSPLVADINRRKDTDHVTRAERGKVVLFCCRKVLSVSQLGPSEGQESGTQSHTILDN